MKVVVKIKNRGSFLVIFFSPKNRAVYERVWKNIVQPGCAATDDNMAHGHCMLDT
jgi:hypothetical protein